MFVGSGEDLVNLDGVAKMKYFDGVSGLCISDFSSYFQTSFGLSCCLNFCVSSPPTMISWEGTMEGSYFMAILNTLKALGEADIVGNPK